MRKLHFSIRLVLLFIISLLNILIAAPLGFMTYRATMNYYYAEQSRYVSEALTHLYTTKKHLSEERATALTLLFVSSESFTDLNIEMQESRRRGQESLDKAYDMIDPKNDKNVAEGLKTVKASFAEFREARTQLDTMALKSEKRSVSVLLKDYFEEINELNKEIDVLIAAYSRKAILSSSEVARQFRLTRILWEISEYAGQEYAISGQLIAENKYPDLETQRQLISLRERISYGMEIANGAIITSNWGDEIKPALEEAKTHYGMIFEQLKNVFYQPGEASEPYPITAEMWLQLASAAVESLQGMTDSILVVNEAHMAQIERNALQEIYLSVFLLAASLALSIYSWWLITSRVIRPVNSMVEALYKETKLSEEEIKENIYSDEISKLRHVLKVFQDNSRQLAKERDNAQAANVAKSEFLANMSHEIRTPMNVVVGLSHILARSKPLTDKQTEYIKTLQVSADSLLSLIDDLLDFSKIEANNFTLDKTAFSLDKLLEDLILVKSFKAKQKGLTFKTEIKNVQGKTYLGDPTRIRQILVNLCGNAIKFTSTGTVSLKVSASPQAKPGFETVVMTISDTGIGIPTEKIESIFEKFTQADTSIVRKFGGTGLGLAITKSLVDMMNGEIRVESKENEGTTFYVSFPLFVKSQEENVKIVQTSETAPAANDVTGKVLLVEDYQPNAIVAGTFLEDFGYQYDLVVNGHDAVKKYMENEYDTILMDVQMPGMDGYQTTKAIRKFERESGRPRVRIIGLTAHASVHDKEKCLAAGMDDYLFKPFEQKKLKEKLQA
jgi:signal transduction histidine kinase/CheY-like chemotaxis protein